VDHGRGVVIDSEGDVRLQRVGTGGSGANFDESIPESKPIL
jgi:hypothetical protein